MRAKGKNNGENEHKRDGFRSRSGFIIACIGSAVGMGNIWRFPMLVSTWGGLTFLLPYFIFVILIASTGVIEEFALGRAGGAGPMGSFGMCTELRYGKRRIGERIGYIPILGSLALAIGYTCVMGWIFKYTFMSFTGDLFSMGQDMDVINGTFGGTASAWGANIWIIVAIAASFAIMSFGIAGGIEKANKVMMPVLFALFLALGVYIFTLDGSSDGYKYILTINPKGLADPSCGYTPSVRRSSRCRLPATEASFTARISAARSASPRRRAMLRYSIRSRRCLRRLSSSLPWRPAALSSTPAAPDLCSSSS